MKKAKSNKTKRPVKAISTRKGKTLFVTVQPVNRQWLDRYCNAQPGNISKATMVDKILQGLRTSAKARASLGL